MSGMDYICINREDVSLVAAKAYAANYGYTVVAAECVPRGWMLIISESQGLAWWRQFLASDVHEVK